MMPGEDGLSLARYIRQRSEIPIIMLTGKGDLIDRVVGSEAGADDYITKPFELREVLARIRTVMRRAAPRPAPAESRPAAGKNADEALVFQGWRLDLVSVSSKDRRESSCPSLPGSSTCCALSRAIPTESSAVSSSSSLVKGRDWAAYDRAIDTQVGRLRKKLEPNPADPMLIKTVRGGGYIFALREAGLSPRRRSAIQQLAQFGLEARRCYRACRANRHLSWTGRPCSQPVRRSRR